MEGSTSLVSRRSLTLYDQLSIVPQNSSKNLRDLLKVPDSSNPSPNSNSSFNDRDPSPSPNTTWRTLRDLLQLHTNPNNPSVAEAGGPVLRPVRVPLMALLEQQPEINVINSRVPPRQSSEEIPEVETQVVTRNETHVATRNETQIATTREEIQSQSQSHSQSGANEERVSLMALLEQSERSSKWEEREEVAEGEGLSCVCCVCMVRRKGAAFIPCGHTFCRRCSRELQANRGTCPLCNGAIAQVLDIF